MRCLIGVQVRAARLRLPRASVAVFLCVAGLGAATTNDPAGAALVPSAAPGAGTTKALEQWRARRLARSTPAARQRRRETRTDYGGYSRAQAVALARARFGDDIGGEIYRGPGLRFGDRIKAYVGRNGAIVTGPNGERRGLLESSFPLRARDASGQLAPVNLALRREDSGDFVASNPLVSTVVPERSSDPVRVGDGGLGVEFDDARPVEGALEGAGAFYSDVALDTDMIAKATIAGAQLLFQLRAQDSPEDFRLNVALPPGSTLRSRPTTVQPMSPDRFTLSGMVSAWGRSWARPWSMLTKSPFPRVTRSAETRSYCASSISRVIGRIRCWWIPSLSPATVRYRTLRRGIGT